MKGKSRNPFPSFEKRKRNLKKKKRLTFEKRKRMGYSFLNLQKEKEIHHFGEETEKFQILFSDFERTKRKFKTDPPLLRKEREMETLFSSFKRRKRTLKTNSPNVFSNFSSNCFPERMHSHISCNFFVFSPLCVFRCLLK